MCLSLRKVNSADVDLLYEWANDSEVRKNAFHTESIPYENHVRWFTKMLEDSSVYQYILCQGELPIGQIRLNVEGSEALIDYSISAEHRGEGFGSKLLELVREQIVADKISDVIKLIGQVKYENQASARAFEKCGFTKREMTDYLQYEFCL
ncbi:MAG: GNAT family N-acetyltransferase [Lachnospiraceae bacterium]|nr:GNAT family N-acetyltransferase [Lachnospiraceae bacterium]